VDAIGAPTRKRPGNGPTRIERHLVITTDGDAWIVEVKSDREARTAEVEAKRQAALEWVNTVNADSATDCRWHYLLATETDLKAASGSWATLPSTCGA